jgi:two-component system response regulator DevR
MIRQGSPVSQHQKALLRLYCVEDCRELRLRISRELAQSGSVEIVGYADAASKATCEIRRLRPDVVLLDLQLVEGSGIEVLRALRTDDDPPIIVVLTNHSDPVSRERSLKAGAQYFFDKSTEFDQLLAILPQLRT